MNKDKQNGRDFVVIERDFMKLAQQTFMLCAHLMDEWEDFFPAMHLLWDKHAESTFPYEVCQYMDDIRDILLELEKMASERISETVVATNVVGEA